MSIELMNVSDSEIDRFRRMPNHWCNEEENGDGACKTAGWEIEGGRRTSHWFMEKTGL